MDPLEPDSPVLSTAFRRSGQRFYWVSASDRAPKSTVQTRTPGGANPLFAPPFQQIVNTTPIESDR